MLNAHRSHKIIPITSQTPEIQITSNMTNTTKVTKQPQDVASTNKSRIGLFRVLRRRRWSTEEKTPSIKKTDSNDDTDSESFSSHPTSPIYDPSDTLSATYESLPDNILHSCLELLTSDNVGLNRIGLQRLNRLINGNVTDSHRSKEIAPYVLVLGGPLGSMEELLRFFFVTMICDAPHNTHCYRAARRAERFEPRVSEGERILEEWVLNYDPSRRSSFNPFEDSEELASESSLSLELEATKKHSQGKAEGALHNHALRILANALSQVYTDEPLALTEMDLPNSLWMSIIPSLVENIERNYNVNTTVYSMKILRILSLVQPTLILPLLKYNLFVPLVELKEFGDENTLPVLSNEAVRLLKLTQGN